MKFEEALELEVGQVIYYRDEQLSCCEVMSAYTPRGIEYLYENNPYVVSFIRGSDMDDKTLFLLNKPGQEITVDYYDIENIEIEVDASKFILPSTDFTLHKSAEFLPLDDAIDFMEKGLAEPSEYLSALAHNNLFNASIDDYLSFLLLSKDKYSPIDFDAYKKRFRYRLKLGHENFLNNPNTEWHPSFDQFAKMDYEKDSTIELKKQRFFHNTHCFVSYMKKEGAKTYGDIIYQLERKSIDESILEVLEEEGLVLNKEFQEAINIGYGRPNDEDEEIDMDNLLGNDDFELDEEDPDDY